MTEEEKEQINLLLRRIPNIAQHLKDGLPGKELETLKEEVPQLKN